MMLPIILWNIELDFDSISKVTDNNELYKAM